MIIDVHAHFCPSNFPAGPGVSADGHWPCMRCESGVAGGMVHFGERPFRRLDARSWSVMPRLEDMDRDGIDIQVLSPMPELLSYWMETSDAETLLDYVNAQIAEAVALSPGRFIGLGAVPLQDPDRAAALLPRLRDAFGLVGVEIGSNINGRILGDPAFEVFFAEAERLDMAVFVHALHPVIAKAVPVTPAFAAFAGFPTDVGLTAASMLLAGVMARHPRLRVAFSHGGGTLTAMLGRLDAGQRMTAGRETSDDSLPSRQAAAFFYDSNVYDPGLVKRLCDLAPGRVFLGTDYPYDIMQKDPAGYLARVSEDPAVRQSLREGAARSFLGPLTY